MFTFVLLRSIFKRVVPKGLDHTLSVITISLYVRLCVVCKVGLTRGGGGVWPPL